MSQEVGLLNPLAKLMVLVCMAVQAVLGGGAGLLGTAAECRDESCWCAAAEKSCCNREGTAARQCGCCARPAERTAPAGERAKLSQLKVEGAMPEGRRPELPRLEGWTLSVRPRVAAAVETPATRVSCGIATTRIVV